MGRVLGGLRRSLEDRPGELVRLLSGLMVERQGAGVGWWGVVVDMMIGVVDKLEEEFGEVSCGGSLKRWLVLCV